MNVEQRSPDRARAGTAALDKGLALLMLIARDGGSRPMRQLAEQLGLAQSTARRLVAALERQGLVTRAERGRYIGGRALIDLASGTDRRALLVRVSRAPICRLAREVDATAHLGVFETDMVTYLIKVQTRSRPVFSREGEQLEAYCSGIGKVLLAHLGDEEREAYIAGGPFVPLTARTIVAPDLIRQELQKVRARGYATDDAEVAEGLYCVAVPVLDAAGNIIAAISVSSPNPLNEAWLAKVLAPLKASARTIASRFGSPSPQP